MWTIRLHSLASTAQPRIHRGSALAASCPDSHIGVERGSQFAYQSPLQLMRRRLATHHSHDFKHEALRATSPECLVQGPALVFATAAIEMLVHANSHTFEHSALSLGRDSDVEVASRRNAVHDVGAIYSFFSGRFLSVHTYIITEIEFLVNRTSQCLPTNFVV